MDNEEFFYGITLSGANATQKWDGVTKDEEGPRAQRLVLKNVLLGHEAKPDEYNVVEATATASQGEIIKIPIAVLKVGETRSMTPQLEFPDGPVIFKLISGSGPVFIHGLLGISGEEGMEEVEFEEQDSEADEDVDEEEGAPKKKIKLSTNNGKAAAGDNKPSKNKK